MDIIFNRNELPQAAAWLLKQAGGKKVVALHGSMGAGKTTLVHAVCQLLGVMETVSSPTYSLINEYRNTNGLPVFHLDLYRLSGEEEAMQAGVEDCLCSGQLCLVEWPEKATNLIPEDALHVQITVINHDTRKLRIIP
jgi:tRNA threonylcarbamoyladenosine biosynthesis protein TsaE